MKKTLLSTVLALSGCLVEGPVDALLYPHPSTPGGCIGIPDEDIPVLFRPCENYSKGEPCLVKILDGYIEVLPEQQMDCRTCLAPYANLAEVEVICDPYEVIQ